MQKQEVFVQRLKSYDTSLDYYVKIYDNLPYVRQRDLCSEENIEISSNNVIKSQQCIVQQPFLISNHDDDFLPLLEEIKRKQEEEPIIEDTIEEELIEDTPPEQITDEQWDAIA